MLSYSPVFRLRTSCIEAICCLFIYFDFNFAAVHVNVKLLMLIYEKPSTHITHF